MINLKTKVAAAFAATALVATPVAAATAGQITGGDNYLVRNVTTNGQFTDPAQAAPCQEVQFKVRIHNVGPDPIDNVNVKATLSNGVATSQSSQVTVSSVDSNPNTRTDTAGVTLSSPQSISYVTGTTELLDANSSKLSTLPDTIFTSGVNIGAVGVSTQQKRYVQFKAKVNCDTPTPVTPVTPGQGGSVQPAATALPETGPEAALGAVAGTGALGYAVMQYRRSRKALADKLLSHRK